MKIFDKIVESVGFCATDAKMKKDSYGQHEVWNYYFEYKKMKDGKKYRIVIIEIEEKEIF